MKRFSLSLLVLLLAAALLMSAAAETAENPTLIVHFRTDRNEMFENANMVLDVSADDFFQVFDLGDIVTVSVPGFVPLDMPVCASYEDVSAGDMLLRAVSAEKKILMAVCFDKMGVMLGMLEAAPEGSPANFVIREGADFDADVTVTLKEKGGWLNRMELSRLESPFDIAGYSDEMSDERFANFYEVDTTGMGRGVLYRSASPINAVLGRNAYADRCCAEAGIRSILNLTDTEEKALSYDGYADTYYSRQNVIFISTPASLASEQFYQGFAKGVRFIIENEGPYLVHCLAGKDRTFFVCAVLEFLMGASLDEVCDNDMRTYENFFAPLADGTVQLTDEIRDAIRGTIISNLKFGLSIENIESVDLRQTAFDYLISIGITQEEIGKLQEALSVNMID